MPRTYKPTGRPPGRPKKMAVPQPTPRQEVREAQAVGLLPNAAPDYDVVWRPQPGPQTAFVQCPLPEVFFGGARGGGKSDALLGDWLGHANRYGRHAVGLFFRRSFPELEEIERRAQELYIPLGAVWKAQNKVFFFPNGATLKLRFLEKDDDYTRYQGFQITWLGIDEAGNFPSAYPIDKLRANLRSAHGVPCVMRLAGNPGGVGHQWLKARYIDPAPPMTPFVVTTENGATIRAVFIPSTLDDNQILLRQDPTYEERLKAAGTAELYEMWRFGRWDVVAGAAFDNFALDAHVLPDFHPPADWQWAAGLDFGMRAKSVLTIFAYDRAGRFVVMDELVWKGKAAFLAGRDVGQWLQARGYRIPIIAADGQMWANTGVATTVGQEFQNGLREVMSYDAPTMLPVAHGPGSIAVRYQVIRRLLDFKRAPDGTIPAHTQPKLRFHQRCAELIKTLPTLPLSAKKDAYDTRGDDHAVDSAGYALMYLVQGAREERGLIEVYSPDKHPGLDPAQLRRRHPERMPSFDGPTGRGLPWTYDRSNVVAVA